MADVTDIGFKPNPNPKLEVKVWRAKDNALVYTGVYNQYPAALVPDSAYENRLVPQPLLPAALQQAGASAEGIAALLQDVLNLVVAPSLLPEKSITTLVANTIAVKTTEPDSLAEWRTALQGISTDFAARGSDYQTEKAFVPLLNFCDDNMHDRCLLNLHILSIR